MLVKLSAHYWRPDFSEGQARQLIADFIDALTPYSLGDIQRAIKAYYTAPENKFFPHPGALIGLIRGPAKNGTVREAITKFDRSVYENWPPEPTTPLKSRQQILEEHRAKNSS